MESAIISIHMLVLTETIVPKTSETIRNRLQVLHTPVPRGEEKFEYISELLLVVEFIQLCCFD